jgi:hypothetical protein
VSLSNEIRWRGVETLYDDDGEVRYEGLTRIVTAENQLAATRLLGVNQPASGYLHIHSLERCS